MKTLHNNYSNSKQGYLPLFLSDCLDLLDHVSSHLYTTRAKRGMKKNQSSFFTAPFLVKKACNKKEKMI